MAIKRELDMVDSRNTVFAVYTYLVLSGTRYQIAGTGITATSYDIIIGILYREGVRRGV
jgi:hypothetical protein